MYTVCILIVSILISVYKLTSFVLPFSYQLTNKRIVGSNILFKSLNKEGRYEIIEKFKKVMDMNIYYRPTWGIKVDKFGKKEYELYFYNYTPDNRILDKVNTVDMGLLIDKLELRSKYPDNMGYVMYSYDIESDMKSPNFYYIGYTNEHVDYGYSEKDNIMQNKYYRYRVNDIGDIHKEYFRDDFIPKDYDEDLKVIFLADKLYRNYIGVYYDGITYNVLKNILMLYDIGDDILEGYNDDGTRFSVSIDICKSTCDIVRVGVYGILY